MTINVKVFSQMEETSEAEKLNKIRTAAFLDKTLLFYLQNGFKKDTVRWLCEKEIVKYDIASDNFFVDWSCYHKAKDTIKVPISHNWSFGKALVC